MATDDSTTLPQRVHPGIQRAKRTIIGTFTARDRAQESAASTAPASAAPRHVRPAQRDFAGGSSGLSVAARLEEPVDPAVAAELPERSPEFRAASAPEGLSLDELETYGTLRRTMRQFLAGFGDLKTEVRDVVLPNADLKPQRA